ncbi:MAG TPA: hypothetical protein VEY30_14235 [Myxococcaceae bacterium]|nr:hypothetical protein [Myxococcaceae bacterium]
MDQSAVLMSALEEGLSDEVARHAALELQLPVGSTLSDEVRAWIADRLLSMAQDPQLDPGRFSESPMPVIDLRVRLARLASAVTVADTAMFTTVINAVPERAAEMRELLNRRNPDGTPTFPVSDFVPVIAQLAFAGRADLNNPAIEVLVGLHTAAIGFVGESAVPENLEPLERAYFEKKPLNVALSAAVEDVLAAQ